MPNPLGRLFGLQPEAGQQPSGLAINDYLANIPHTAEQQRESQMLAGMDARTNESFDADLAQAEGVRGARSLGFDGAYPMREQADYVANQKLRQVLLPEQVRAEALYADRDANRQFDAYQHDMDRQSREGIAARAQEAQTGRVNAQQQGITSRAQAAQQSKQGGLGKLWGWLTGSGGSTPQTASTPSVSGNDGGGMVLMQAPTGEQQMVPAARVQEFVAKGASVIE